MSSIGPFYFIRMDGDELTGLSYQVKEFDRPGIDGVGFYFGAAKAPLCQKVTVEGVANAVTANTAQENYQALKGSMITVVDDTGRTKSSVMVINVQVLQKKQVLLSTTGYGYYVTAAWTLKATTA